MGEQHEVRSSTAPAFWCSEWELCLTVRARRVMMETHPGARFHLDTVLSSSDC